MSLFVPWSSLSESDRQQCRSYLMRLFDDNLLDAEGFIDAMIDFHTQGVNCFILDFVRGIPSAC